MPKKIPPQLQSSCTDCNVRKLAWFEPHTDEEHLAKRLHRRDSQTHYETNEHVFIEGDINNKIFTLKEGWAICYKQLTDGHRQVISIALPGDLIGYHTDSSMPIDYSVITATECIFCSFTLDAVDELLLEEFALNLRLLQLQHHDNRSCRQNLSIVSQAQAKMKVAHFLNTLINRLEKRGVDIGKDIAFPLSRMDMADAVGISYIHLSRICVSLNKDQIITCENNSLRLIDRTKLQNLANIVF